MAAIRASGTQGGDSKAAALTADNGAFDITSNPQVTEYGLTIVETLDI